MLRDLRSLLIWPAVGAIRGLTKLNFAWPQRCRLSMAATISRTGRGGCSFAWPFGAEQLNNLLTAYPTVNEARPKDDRGRPLLLDRVANFPSSFTQ
jgi:hypothetical protein